MEGINNKRVRKFGRVRREIEYLEGNKVCKATDNQ
jgi:hypothetical protein